MWLFSRPADSSSDAPPGRRGSSDDGDDRDAPTTTAKDERSSAMLDDGDAPRKSYSAVHAGDGGAPPPPTQPQRTTNGANNGVHRNGAASGTNIARRKQRGMIYFRPIKPSDRTVVQEMHERWFPVDYKSEFFDALCSSSHCSVNGDGDCSTGNGEGRQERRQQGSSAARRRKTLGAYGTEPLYCRVACFRELGDEEYEERRRRREGRKREGAGWGSSLWPSRNDQSDDDDGYDDDDDCILWEIDNAKDDDRIKREGKLNYQNSVEIQNSSQDDNDDAMEGGESVFSIHHRTEKERMKRFYSNGFRFDRSEEARRNGEMNGYNDSNDSHNHNNDNHNSRNNSEEGPYYNDDGERIAGCIVGSFLPSAMPSSRHTSSLDEKPSRDPTASLLVPDHSLHRYERMFYIMTLGTSAEFRRCGLGSVLVERVVEMIEGEREDCGALYLHVITYNRGAIRLYEGLGFDRVKTIKDYYTINSVNYDCYLYARYFHGNRGHRTTLGVLFNLAASILRKLSDAFVGPN